MERERHWPLHLALAELTRNVVSTDVTSIDVTPINNDSRGFAAIEVADKRYAENPPERLAGSLRTSA